MGRLEEGRKASLGPASPGYGSSLRPASWTTGLAGALRGPWPERVRFWTLIAALLFCLIAGGSARADIPLLLLLRPALILALLVLVLTPGRWDIARVRMPVLLLCGLALLMLVQLIPLPPGLWTALPGHERYVEAAAAVGMAQPWRPISLTPYLTMNSLLALLPAAVALVGMARLREDQRQAFLPVLIGLACAGALLGIVQITGRPDGPAFLYDITHTGSAVGFFANRNHQAVLLAITFPMLRVWTLQASEEAQRYRSRLVIASTIGLFLVPMLLATGSRLGAVLGLIGICAALMLFPAAREAMRTKRSRLLAVMAWVAPLVLAILAVVLGRGLAVDRIVNGDLLAEPRLTHLPTLVGMVRNFFPVGTGFGSFDPVFRGFEPDWALSLRYFNHAHNELIELVLTGGIAALLLLLVFLFWVGRLSIMAFFRTQAGKPPVFARLGLVIIAMLMLSSLVEYSLRTPLMGMICAIACVWAATPVRSETARASPPGAGTSARRARRSVRHFLRSTVIVLLGGGAITASTVVTAQLTAGYASRANFLTWPGGGSADSRAKVAASLLERRATPEAIARATQLARAALVQEPVNVEAARTLGLIALLRNRDEQAAQLFAYAETLSRRDLPTQLWLIENRVRQNNVAGALVHYDRALRTSDEAYAILLPILTQAAAYPEITPALARLVAGRPPWALPFAARLFRESDSPVAIAAVARALKLDSRSAMEANLLRQGLERLVRLNAYDQAWSVYRQTPAGRAAPAYIRNGAFDDDMSQGHFDWSLTTSPGLSARPSPIEGHPGLALLLGAESGRGGELARQLLKLGAGSYALGFEAGWVSGDESARRIVRLTCADSGRELLAFDLRAAPASGRAFRQRFTVPAADCPAQLLSISTMADLTPVRTEAWIDSIAILPTGG